MMASRLACVSGLTQNQLSLPLLISMPFSIILLILPMVSTFLFKSSWISTIIRSLRPLFCRPRTRSASASTTRYIFIRSDTSHRTFFPAATLQNTQQRRSRSGNFLSQVWMRFFTAGCARKNSIRSRRDCSSSALWRGCFIHRLRQRVPKAVLHWLRMSNRVLLLARVFRSMSLGKICRALIVALSSVMLARRFTSCKSNCPLLLDYRSILVTQSNFSRAILNLIFSNSFVYMLQPFFSKNPKGSCKSPLPNFPSWILQEYSANFSRTFLRSPLILGMVAWTSKTACSSLGLFCKSSAQRQEQCSVSRKAPIVKRRVVLVRVAKVTSRCTPVNSMLMYMVTA